MPASLKNKDRSPRRAAPAATLSGGGAASALVQSILSETRKPAFVDYLKSLLLELCRIDTTPNPVVEKMRLAEDGCFRILERELAALEVPGARLERRPIRPAIQGHRHFSLLHFTKTAERPEGLSPEETYAGRANLTCLLPGANQKDAGQSVALNAHIDVVAPYFPPRVQGGTVYGRGACDDKGPVVSMVAALKVLSQVLEKAGLRLNRNVLAMFVVEEETGGNGSLSLAMERELKPLYDSILVGECTGLKFHPANRGAVWYRAELTPPAGVSAFEMFAFVNEEMEKEGAAIRAESRHGLFPQRPVQTCHGILGGFGEHPSRICGEVRFAIQAKHPLGEEARTLIEDCLESGLASYLGLYGDKTKVTDSATGKPMVARHYDCRALGNGLRIEVHGATGHMGAIRERDGAITKLAHLVRSLVLSKAKIEAAVGGPVCFELLDPASPAEAGQGSEAASPPPSPRSLILEGGQGFVPTHGIEEVMERMRQAAQRGAQAYLLRLGRAETGSQIVRVTYEKLHNVAFDGDVNSPSVQNAIAAAKTAGLWKDEPVLGWTVSCDARLFATEYPGMEVLTFGPGQLAFAHSDQEQVELEDVRKAVEFLALFLLLQTGTLSAA